MASRCFWVRFAGAVCAAGVRSVIIDGATGAAAVAAADSAWVFNIIQRRSNAAFVVREPLSSLRRHGNPVQTSNVGSHRRRHLKNNVGDWGASASPVVARASPDHPSQAAVADKFNRVEEWPPFSESDIIRTLRASPRRHERHGSPSQRHPEQATACRTVFDVLHLMDQAPASLLPDPASLSNCPNEEIASRIEAIANATSPNIAAAALRRLASPPFLPAMSYRRNSKRKWPDQSRSSGSPAETYIYGQLVRVLLEKLNTSMEHQSRGLASMTLAQHDDHSPSLLPHRDSWLVPPSTKDKSRESLNWYALADVLYSLSSLCHVLGSRNRGNSHPEGHFLSHIAPREHWSMMSLFDGAIQYLAWDNKMTSSFVRCVGPRRLVRDVVQPLVAMAVAKEEANRGTEDWVYNIGTGAGEAGVASQQFPLASPNNSCSQLMAVLSSYVALPSSLEKLTASDLAVTLWSTTQIYAPTGGKQMTLQSPQRILLRTFMKRLRKCRVRSPAQGKELVQAVWSVARLIGGLEEQERTLRSPLPTHLTAKASSSWSMKGGIARVTTSQPRVVPIFPPQPAEATDIVRNPTDVPLETLREEAVIMYHTLANDIVHPPPYSKGQVESHTPLKLQSLSLREIADILQAATSLSISHRDIRATVTEILKHLTANPTSPRSPLRQCHRCKDIARLLLSLQRLRVGSGVFNEVAVLTDESDGNADDAASGESSDSVEENDAPDASGLEERCVRLLGERFFDIVRWHGDHHSKRACNGKTLATAVRASVMMFQRESAATVAILDAASLLILDRNREAPDDGDRTASSFLSSCNEFEVSNYLFAFAVAKRFDECSPVLVDEMMEDDILQSCTPSSASRAMWSCSMLWSLDEASSPNSSPYNTQHEFAQSTGGESFLYERQIDLFHQLSPLLLWSPLSPTDASCAMFAMAKAQYVVDTEIFNQLAMSLSSEEMLERSNTRLISQAIWSCGKMVEFMRKGFKESDQQLTAEDQDIIYRVPDDGDENTGIERVAVAPNLPPYLECADKYLRFLVANQAQMTPHQVTTTIWAIGRLKLSDSFLVNEMGDIASLLCPKLNAREIANIVWGLSKVDYDKPEIISKLIHRVITSKNLTQECTAQEAANMLFALGKLQIQDTDAFASLSSILSYQLHEATSQAIANALWAHEVVGIKPPTELLSTWAQDRLGMAVFGITQSKYTKA